ncbi:MAG: Nramp family divalent metal transporter [Chloroflexota bacterium]
MNLLRRDPTVDAVAPTVESGAAGVVPTADAVAPTVEPGITGIAAAAEPGAATAAIGPRRRRRVPFRPAAPIPRWRLRFAASLAVLGPGIVAGFADNDAGGITTYSLAGARYGYALLWVLLASQVALFFTQEMGARMGIATGQGLTGLIRERFGVRWAAFAAGLMLIANQGSIISEFAGIGTALGLFGVPLPVATILAAVAVVLLISRGSYGKVQYFFVAVGIAISVAYAISAYLAQPDWPVALHSLVVPQLQFNGAYWLAVVGTVGTTITPWGQAFIQAYVVDKRLGREQLTAERADVAIGTLITNVVAAFIVVACAATLWSNGITNITDAGQAATALGPLVGEAATWVFGLGLLAASLLGLGVVPLASAYTATEAFGWEAGIDHRWGEAPAFYGILAFIIGFSAIFVLIPGLPLITVMFLAQVLNGILLPFILVFVMLLAGDRRLMGSLANGRILNAIGWTVTALLVVMSLVLVVASVAGAG